MSYTALVPPAPLQAPPPPLRFRSLATLLGLAVVGSIALSTLLMPSRIERLAVATEHGDQALVQSELDVATQTPVDPGEARALVNVALQLGQPDKAAEILERFLAVQPESVPGIRLLLEVQRQRHRLRDVAALDERIFALVGDPDALREAADIYASQRMSAERVDALRRLFAIERATASDMAELTHRLADQGQAAETLGMLMAWLSAPRVTTLPPELVGLAASLSITGDGAAETARRLGTLIGAAGEEGPLQVLVQVYAERGRPDLSLIAARALDPAMQARPDVALMLAQLEALQGQYASARRRLDDLDRAGTLLPAGLPMLIDLSTQAGDLDRAVIVTKSLAPDQVPEGLPHRLLEAIYNANRPELLAQLPVEPFAASSPASAATIALARGEIPRATTLARVALGPGGDVGDLGPAFGSVARSVGLERETAVRLADAARQTTLDDDALTLLSNLAAAPRADIPTILGALRAQRDVRPRAGVVWAAFAARNGKASEVTDWLNTQASTLPAQSLIELLLAAIERREPILARAAGDAASTRTDLPAGWTAGEIAFTIQALEPLTLTRLRAGLERLGSPATNPAARDRIAALLVDARNFAELAQQITMPPSGELFDWLAASAASGGRTEADLARLGLFAALFPRQAVGVLADDVSSDPRRLIPLYAASLLRIGRQAEAQGVLLDQSHRMSSRERDTMLQETLARVAPTQALPILRIGASSGRPDWVAAYEEALARAGLRDELRAELRQRAAAANADPKLRLALASRLVELDDRVGAIAVLQTEARGKKPGSSEVEQLMFLWGPRADREAVAWTRERALASDRADLPKWLEHLAYLAAPRAVIDVIESRPETLATSPAVASYYGTALVAAHAQVKPILQPAIAAATTPEVLSALARLSIDTQQTASAWAAASAAVARAPQDQTALHLAGQAAAAIHRSADAASFYARLLAKANQSAEIMVDAGDAFLTAQRTNEGRAVLEAALRRIPASPKTQVDARLRARALTLLHRDSEAQSLLAPWLEKAPGQAGLRGDMLQSRIDQRTAR